MIGPIHVLRDIRDLPAVPVGYVNVLAVPLVDVDLWHDIAESLGITVHVLGRRSVPADNALAWQARVSTIHALRHGEPAVPLDPDLARLAMRTMRNRQIEHQRAADADHNVGPEADNRAGIAQGYGEAIDLVAELLGMSPPDAVEDRSTQ